MTHGFSSVLNISHGWSFYIHLIHVATVGGRNDDLQSLGIFLQTLLSYLEGWAKWKGVKDGERCIATSIIGIIVFRVWNLFTSTLAVASEVATVVRFRDNCRQTLVYPRWRWKLVEISWEPHFCHQLVPGSYCVLKAETHFRNPLFMDIESGLSFRGRFCTCEAKKTIGNPIFWDVFSPWEYGYLDIWASMHQRVYPG